MKLLAVIVLCLLAAGANARSTRIVNGENVLAVVPFYVYIELHRLPGLQGAAYFGGGSLVSQQAILTVAQNVAGFQSWRAGLGAITLQGLQWHAVATTHVHPEFDSMTLAHNIAILRLTAVVPISPNILPITRIPPGSQFPQTGNIGVMVGFGFGATLEQPVVLQQATLTTLSQEVCAAFYPHLVANGQIGNHFCAQNTVFSNVCAGDQGGPMYSPDLNILIGVISFNRVADCTSADSQPVGLLRVAEYNTFINPLL